MSNKTSIEWTRGDDGTAGATWNPVRGCVKVSPGCKHCYATDQIGSRVPAVPHPTGSFWGYTSVPDDGVKWWKALPTRGGVS